MSHNYNNYSVSHSHVQPTGSTFDVYDTKSDLPSYDVKIGSLAVVKDEAAIYGYFYSPSGTPDWYKMSMAQFNGLDRAAARLKEKDQK